MFLKRSLAFVALCLVGPAHVAAAVSQEKAHAQQMNRGTAATAPAAQGPAAWRMQIARQLQPCANSVVSPGSGAERIRVLFRITLKPDGALAGDPVVTGVQGVDADNAIYAEKVKDRATAMFKACAPFSGLPAQFYDVPNGWKSLAFAFKLPG